MNESEAKTETPLFLPPCNTAAEKPEDVYSFDQCILFSSIYICFSTSFFFCVKIPNFVLVLSPIEFDALKDVGMKMAALTPEDLQKMRAELWYGEHHAVDDKGFL